MNEAARPGPSQNAPRRTGRAWRTVPALAAGVLATLIGALAVLVLPRRWRRRRAATDAVLRTWARAWLLATGTRVRVEGRERLDPSTAYVVVANHRSNLDPMVLLAVFGSSLRVLAKRELFDVPLLGQALRAAGIVEVDRRHADRRAINEAVATALAEGTSLLIFPEGTFSGGGLLPFKPGAFLIAVDNGVPLVPVALEGVDRAWPPERLRILGGEVRVLIGEPLPTAHLTPQDADPLRHRVRDLIGALLQRDREEQGAEGEDSVSDGYSSPSDPSEPQTL